MSDIVKMYRLKETWQHFPDMESAIVARIQEAVFLAQRQGAHSPRWDRVAPFVCEMFEEVTSSPAAETPQPPSGTRRKSH